MANMPGRNGVASSLHYPLLQPASSPVSQADKQQFTWNFRAPLAQTIIVNIRGLLVTMYRQNPLVEMRRH